MLINSLTGSISPKIEAPSSFIYSHVVPNFDFLLWNIEEKNLKVP